MDKHVGGWDWQGKINLKTKPILGAGEAENGAVEEVRRRGRFVMEEGLMLLWGRKSNQKGEK